MLKRYRVLWKKEILESLFALGVCPVRTCLPKTSCLEKTISRSALSSKTIHQENVQLVSLAYIWGKSFTAWMNDFFQVYITRKVFKLQRSSSFLVSRRETRTKGGWSKSLNLCKWIFLSNWNHCQKKTMLEPGFEAIVRTSYCVIYSPHNCGMALTT